jgi:hypothetical protein
MNRDQKWARAIMERDSWMCQNCGTTKHLDAAHIISKHVNPALRHELSNGVTLCRKCHQFYHCFPSEFGCFTAAFQQGHSINAAEHD